MSEKNLTPFDSVNMKEIEEGLIIADGERLGHFDITANGDYAASTQGMAGFSDVSVNVPNTYTNEDEGKVVNSGALVAQTAMAEEITENNTYDTTNYNSVTVNVAGSGGMVGRDVRFYDYDGALVYGYSAEDFANLTEMPPNPTHEGLTAQGWNWNLSDAKAHVAAYGELNIGQMYITTDGKTSFDWVIDSSNTYSLGIILSSGVTIVVDWGDENDPQEFVGPQSQISHAYSISGRYHVTIKVTEGNLRLGNSSQGIAYKFLSGCTAENLKIGERIISIEMEPSAGVSSINIPSNLTYPSTDFARAGINKTCVNFLMLPSGVTEGLGAFGYVNNQGLKIISLPYGITKLSGLSGCTALSSITIPNTVTQINYQAFYSCKSLTSITIPNNVSSIDITAFKSCDSLMDIYIDNTENSINGAPWGASGATIHWLRS